MTAAKPANSTERMNVTTSSDGGSLLVMSVR